MKFLNKTVIQYNWEQQIILSVPKINVFLSDTPEKMDKITEEM